MSWSRYDTYFWILVYKLHLKFLFLVSLYFFLCLCHVLVSRNCNICKDLYLACCTLISYPYRLCRVLHKFYSIILHEWQELETHFLATFMIHQSLFLLLFCCTLLAKLCLSIQHPVSTHCYFEYLSVALSPHHKLPYYNQSSFPFPPFQEPSCSSAPCVHVSVHCHDHFGIFLYFQKFLLSSVNHSSTIAYYSYSLCI